MPIHLYRTECYFFVGPGGITAVFYGSIMNTLLQRISGYYNNRTLLKRVGSAAIKGNGRNIKIVRRW